MSSTDHYHIKLELYPTPNPLSGTAARGKRGRGGSGNLHDDHGAVWRPTIHSSIFDELPSHPSRSATGNKSQDNKAVQARGGAEIGTEGGVIDCGASSATGEDNGGVDNNTSSEDRTAAERHNNLAGGGGREKSSFSPSYRTGLGPSTSVKDWRFGRINIESFDLGPRPSPSGEEQIKERQMEGNKGLGASEGEDAKGKEHAALLGPNLGGVGSATKARYVPLEMKNTEAGWGIVHLYKESVEPVEMRAAFAKPDEGGSSAAHEGVVAVGDEEGTILCIPSVPGYLSPTDFLSWVGDKWRDDVAHYRMVMTSTMYRYMVLMKLQDHSRAVAWQKEFAGKPFPGINPELCQVAFIKSITVETPDDTDIVESGDSSKGHGKSKQPWGPSNLPSVSEKPFPPPTPDLTELPTCSVCLERMDNTAGLVTIPCQHIFHCTCLQTWKGSGCPICRATTPATHASAAVLDPNDPLSRPFGTDISNVCYMCNWNEDLWICLICGNVGCGRYKGGHAKEHWRKTAHSFSLEIETQYVWDYASDSWVHRLLRNKEEKLVELPMTNANERSRTTGSQQETAEDVVPRAKLDNLSLEYTNLYIKQLESQRMYYEDLVNKARDKANKAAMAAEQASSNAQKAVQALADFREEFRAYREHAETTIPSLEKDILRERARAEKSTEIARTLTRSLQEEKEISKGLLEKVHHLEEKMNDSVSVQEMTTSLAVLMKENKELKEELDDLRAYITGSEQVEQMKESGQIEQSELDEASIAVPRQETPPPEAGPGSSNVQDPDAGSSSNAPKKGKKKNKVKAKK